MIRGSGLAKLAAVSVALGLHGALAVALVSRQGVEIEGADGGAEVRLGNEFADLAAGTLTAIPAQALAQAEAALPQRIAAEIPSAAPLEQANRAEQATPAEAILPEAALKVLPTASAALVASGGARVAALARPLRPIQHSPSRKAAHTASAVKPVVKPKPTRPAAAPKPGNAERDARAGEATGKPDAAARQSGTGGRQQASGNAAASNYAGLVMRKLSRVGKPRVNARGAAMIAFTISANGGLASVSLARSSGSSALDQAALRLVKGAGPFPKPPQGAGRHFSIQIKGR